MFDLLISSISAYNQVGLFLGAFFCLGLGGLLLGNAFYWRLHAHRASGTIIGVIASGTTYAPVYRYITPEGETHEARADVSSSGTSGKQTGRVVPLMIAAHNPSSARAADSYSLEIIGLVLALPGLVLGYVALTAYPVTPMTWIMGALMTLYLLERGHRTLIPKGERPSLAEWKAQHGTSAMIDPTEVKRIEDLVPAATVQQNAQARAQKARKWAPVLGVFAIILAALAVWQSMHLAHLESTGVRAPGQVVRLHEEWRSGSSGGGHYTYYPIVRFRTAENETIEFRDSIGSNPPSYRSGDKVTVLYLADAPHGNAMIDRGSFWNWAIPGGIFVAALVLAGVFITMLRGPTARPATA
ncbi:MAG TPA: DUF3592 domain-containing protein [Stellaceae bacterium]|nr:DUF3592 domain-containing protein [Stellaceae bacterium]